MENLNIAYKNNYPERRDPSIQCYVPNIWYTRPNLLNIEGHCTVDRQKMNFSSLVESRLIYNFLTKRFQ